MCFVVKLIESVVVQADLEKNFGTLTTWPSTEEAPLLFRCYSHVVSRCFSSIAKEEGTSIVPFLELVNHSNIQLYPIPSTRENRRGGGAVVLGFPEAWNPYRLDSKLPYRMGRKKGIAHEFATIQVRNGFMKDRIRRRRLRRPCRSFTRLILFASTSALPIALRASTCSILG